MQRRRKNEDRRTRRSCLTRKCVPTSFCLGASGYLRRLQRPCKTCGSPYTAKQGNWHHLCKACDHKRRYPFDSAAAVAAPTLPTAPPQLFERDEHSHGHLSQEQRIAIRILRKEGYEVASIAARIPCHENTVRHWLAQEDTHDSPRSGRKRKTTAEQDAAIIAEAKETKFTTPRRIRRKLGMDASVDTIDRRLIEAGLPGRVARHVFQLTDDHKRQRLSFAHGYSRWTGDEWCKVVFADIKTFRGLGRGGQVWVRRPVGAAIISTI